MAKKKNVRTRNTLTYETLPALFTGICDALRSKTGGSDPIAHQSIPSIIADIPVAGNEEILESYYDTSASSYDALSKSYTVGVTGTLYFIYATGHRNSGGSETLKLNNVTQTRNKAITSGDSGFRYYSFSVTVGDVIDLSVPVGGGSSGAYDLILAVVIGT